MGGNIPLGLDGATVNVASVEGSVEALGGAVVRNLTFGKVATSTLQLTGASDPRVAAGVSNAGRLQDAGLLRIEGASGIPVACKC